MIAIVWEIFKAQQWNWKDLIFNNTLLSVYQQLHSQGQLYNTAKPLRHRIWDKIYLVLWVASCWVARYVRREGTWARLVLLREHSAHNWTVHYHCACAVAPAASDVTDNDDNNEHSWPCRLSVSNRITNYCLLQLFTDKNLIKIKHN